MERSSAFGQFAIQGRLGFGFRWFIEIEISFAFGASSRTCSYRRPGCPSSGPCTVWQNGVSMSPPNASPSMPVWSWTTSNSSALTERVDRVLHLPVRVPDPLARRGVEDGLEPRAGLRVARREERDVVTRVDEPVGEQRDDALGAAVRLRRDREPDGTERPTLIAPPVSRHTPSAIVTRPRSTRPSSCDRKRERPRPADPRASSEARPSPS